jgi:hypothetical protein
MAWTTSCFRPKLVGNWSIRSGISVVNGGFYRLPFALRSLIAVRFARSGAGSAAYRFSWPVNAPGYGMSLSLLRTCVRASFGSRALAIGILLCPVAASAEPSANAIVVNIDQAKLVKLPDRVSTIIVGNPLIADITLQNGGIVVLTGKGYGATNFIAMDRAGEVLADRVIQVEGPADQLVTVYKGVHRESYSCMPICQPRITLGDSPTFFGSAIDQAGSLSGQASAAGTTKSAN